MGALPTPSWAQPRTPPRRHRLTSLSPARHGDPSSTCPYSTVSLLGLPWVYLLGICGCVGSRVLGFAGSCSLGAGRGRDPILPSLCSLVEGAKTQAGSWGHVTPEGGFSNGSPATWDQFGDPTPSMLISLPSEGEGQRGAGPLLPVEVEGSPTLSVKGTMRSGIQISPSSYL